MDDLVGRVIGPGGRYRLLEVIGKGGTATVFRAEQLNLQRQVAVKVADPALAGNPAFVARFQREIGALARLEHSPHMLPVYDVGDDGGLLYLVMRLVRGGTLKTRLERAPGRPWTLRQAQRLATQVLSALADAHGRGLIHRDVKPSNILLEGDYVYLADFGIAKVLQAGTDGAVMGPTLTGVSLVGTPTYMAPEQALGLAVDQRADLYAFGVVLYELLTGRVPYQAQTPMQMAFRHVEASLPPPRELNPALPVSIEAVLLRALARQPEHRFPTAEAFDAALGEAVEVAEPPARPSSGPPAGGPPGDRTEPDLVAQPPAGPPAPPAPPTTMPDPSRDDVDAFLADLLGRLDRVQRKQAVQQVQVQARRPQQGGRAPADGPAGARKRWGAAPVVPLPDPPPAQSPPAPPAPRAQPTVEPVREVPKREGTKRPRRRVVAASVAGLAGLGAVGLAISRLTRPGQGPVVPGTPTTVAQPTAIPTPGAPPPLARARVSHTATVLPGGRVIVVGGQGSDGGTLGSAELYDPAANRWSAAAALTRPRAGHTATLLSGGQVLVVGGQDSEGRFLGSTELYDPAANRWTSVEPMSSTRGEHAATLLESGRVLVTGGKNDALYHPTAELFDPATRLWSAAGRFEGDSRAGHAAAPLPGGAALVCGGTDASRALATAERFNPATNSWTSVASLAAGRIGSTASALKSGAVLVVGGYGFSSHPVELVLPTAAERYDLQSTQWASAVELKQGRVAHTTTVLANGQVLVVGGQGSDGGSLGSAELYDPAANRWSAAATLTRPRAGHTATLLSDGQVLVVGGRDGTEHLASVERYDPATGRWMAG